LSFAFYAGKENVKRGGEVDKFCWDCLSENYEEELTSEYTSYSLAIPNMEYLEAQ